MFFIHGGGYMFGSSATSVYDGAAIARRGAVYVSANYRLGALGCLDLSSLSTPEHPLEANLFLRDLVMALRWVRDNIAEFGGDPDNVTIFGESAGAHAVATLLAVPDAAGLFHQAISESPPGGLIHPADVLGRSGAQAGRRTRRGSRRRRARRDDRAAVAARQDARTDHDGHHSGDARLVRDRGHRRAATTFRARTSRR